MVWHYPGQTPPRVPDAADPVLIPLGDNTRTLDVQDVSICFFSLSSASSLANVASTCHRDCDRLLVLDWCTRDGTLWGHEAARGLSTRATTQTAGHTFHPSASSIMVCSPICKAGGQQLPGRFGGWLWGNRREDAVQMVKVGPA
jgi:hypothetical protein